MKIYIGADHNGFYLKEHIKPWLKAWQYDYQDLGALTLDHKDDYTFYAAKVARAIMNDKNSFGILLCGSGVGADIVANKFDGVRASIGKSVAQIEAGRHDDNMNVLVLASSYTKDKEAKDMIKIFLKTKFSRAKRFKKRLKDIEKIERDQRSTNS